MLWLWGSNVQLTKRPAEWVSKCSGGPARRELEWCTRTPVLVYILNPFCTCGAGIYTCLSVGRFRPVSPGQSESPFLSFLFRLRLRLFLFSRSSLARGHLPANVVSWWHVPLTRGAWGQAGRAVWVNKLHWLCNISSPLKWNFILRWPFGFSKKLIETGMYILNIIFISQI